MKIHNPKYLMASYRFNGTIGDTNGKILDVSKHNRHIIYSPSGDPMYTTNDLGKSSNEFKNGYPIAQRLDKVTSTGLPVDRIGSVGLPTFTNNGCKKFNGAGDILTIPKVGTGTVDSIFIEFYSSDEITSTSTFKTIFGHETNNLIFIGLGGFTTAVADETISINSSPSSVRLSYIKDQVPAGWHTLGAVWDGSKYAITLDGQARTTYTYVEVPKLDSNAFRVGGRFGGPYFEGLVSRVEIGYSDSGTVVFPLQETAGDIIYDISTNEIEGAIIPSEGAGDASGILRINSGRRDDPFITRNKTELLGSDITSSTQYDSFPWAILHPVTGDIELYYRSGTNHVGPPYDAVIKKMTSSDLGATWTSPAVFLTAPEGVDQRDFVIKVLSNGVYLAAYTLTETIEASPRNVAYTMYSSDHGATWSTPVQHGSGVNWAATTEPYECSDGRVLVPLFQFNYNLTATGVFIATADISDLDTWSPPVAIANPDTSASESFIQSFSDGEIRIFVRSQGATIDRYYLSSMDEGLTWGDIQPCVFDIPTNPCRPNTVRLPGSDVLLTSTRSGSGSQIKFFLSFDRGENWVWTENFLPVAVDMYSAYVTIGNVVYDITSLEYSSTSAKLYIQSHEAVKASPSENIVNGFSLYTHATLDPIRVPYDVNGDPLSITPPTGYTLASEHPGGYLHNGAESTITQTDSDLLTNEFWSSDGITFDDKTYDDLLACDGSQGVYVSKEGSNITEILTESFNGNDPNNIDGYSANLGVQLDAFTIFGTFKCNDVYSSRDHSICALYDISDNLLFKIKLVGDVDKYLVFTGSDDGIGNSSSNIIVNDKNIHSFACTFDGENWNIYIDGDFNSTEIDEYSSTETIVLKVGKCDSDSFLGNIGNIRIYNTVLESNDIQLLHVEAMNPPMAVAINGTPLEELIESINSEKLGWLNDPLVGEWLNDPLVGEWLNNPLSGASLSGFRVVLGTIDGFNDYSGNSNEFTVSEGIVGNGIILNNGKINWEESTFESYMYVFEPTDGSGIKFCSYSEGIHRVNLVEDEPPLTITSTGMSETASGKIHKVEAYNYDIPFPLLKLLYLKESRYF